MLDKKNTSVGDSQSHVNPQATSSKKPIQSPQKSSNANYAQKSNYKNMASGKSKNVTQGNTSQGNTVSGNSTKSSYGNTAKKATLVITSDGSPQANNPSRSRQGYNPSRPTNKQNGPTTLVFNRNGGKTPSRFQSATGTSSQSRNKSQQTSQQRSTNFNNRQRSTGSFKRAMYPGKPQQRSVSYSNNRNLTQSSLPLSRKDLKAKAKFNPKQRKRNYMFTKRLRKPQTLLKKHAANTKQEASSTLLSDMYLETRSIKSNLQHLRLFIKLGVSSLHPYPKNQEPFFPRFAAKLGDSTTPIWVRRLELFPRKKYLNTLLRPFIFDSSFWLRRDPAPLRRLPKKRKIKNALKPGAALEFRFPYQYTTLPRRLIRLISASRFFSTDSTLLSSLPKSFLPLVSKKLLAKTTINNTAQTLRTAQYKPQLLFLIKSLTARQQLNTFQTDLKHTLTQTAALLKQQDNKTLGRRSKNRTEFSKDTLQRGPKSQKKKFKGLKTKTPQVRAQGLKLRQQVVSYYTQPSIVLNKALTR